MRMAPDWDVKMIDQMRRAPSKKPILSAYPSSGWQDFEANANFGLAGPRMCGANFMPDEYGVVRIDAAYSREPDNVPAKRPVPSPWIAAGYFFAPGSFVKDVPFDPMLPWIFMGEELGITARAWTSGYDVFAPNA